MAKRAAAKDREVCHATLRPAWRDAGSRVSEAPVARPEFQL